MAAFERLHSACVLIKSRQWDYEFRRTVLFLIGFGAELALKANLLSQGNDVTFARKFDHDIFKMWDSNLAQSFREIARAAVARIPSESECYVCTLERHIKTLDELHTKRSGFALRYVVAPDATAPSPILMLIAFMTVTKQLIFVAISKWENEEPGSDALDFFKLKFSESAYMKFNPVEYLLLKNGKEKLSW